MPQQRLLLSWGSFDRAVKVMAAELRDLVGEETIIVAPPRGGLPLAVALSHALQLPFQITLDGTVPGETRPILWVDDVLDRGLTYRRLREVHPDATAAVWVSKQAEQEGVFVVQYCTADTWVVFPWEQEDLADIDRAGYLARRTAEEQAEP